MYELLIGCLLYILPYPTPPPPKWEFWLFGVDDFLLVFSCLATSGIACGMGKASKGHESFLASGTVIQPTKQ